MPEFYVIFAIRLIKMPNFLYFHKYFSQIWRARASPAPISYACHVVRMYLLFSCINAFV